MFFWAVLLQIVPWITIHLLGSSIRRVEVLDATQPSWGGPRASGIPGSEDPVIWNMVQFDGFNDDLPIQVILKKCQITTGF